jgi:hypothetical protein
LKQQVVVGISDRVEAQILEAVKVRVLKLDAFLQIYNWFGVTGKPGKKQGLRQNAAQENQTPRPVFPCLKLSSM